MKKYLRYILIISSSLFILGCEIDDESIDQKDTTKTKEVVKLYAPDWVNDNFPMNSEYNISRINEQSDTLFYATIQIISDDKQSIGSWYLDSYKDDGWDLDSISDNNIIIAEKGIYTAEIAIFSASGNSSNITISFKAKIKS